jgi:cell division protein FtsL
MSMGAVAARSVEREERGRRDHLRVVPRPTVGESRRASSRASARAQDSRARAVFNGVAVLLIALTAVGLVRVAVLARAAEMTLTESGLAKAIKSQRIETDRLEMDRSGLAASSRIEQIAGATMQMGAPASVRYITMKSAMPSSLPAGTATAVAQGVQGASAAAAPSGAARVAAVLSALVEMSAGEAQSLLVGDVGLAGSR